MRTNEINNISIVLFDADGVLTLPEEMFSLVYAKSHGLPYEPFEKFFKNEWSLIVTGKKDLKESISENSDLWQWSGTSEELLDYWFKTEDVRNDELINLIQEIRNKGIKCCLATDQEKYRAKYMKDVMFKNLFDDHFVSADLGVIKSNPLFFKKVFEKLKENNSLLQPENVIFYDDSESKIESAKSVGFVTCLYTDIEQVRFLVN